jgi:predicted nucleic acid-binding protein
MIVLLDTNVVLDILLNRQPWYNEAALIFGLSEKKLINCFISASSITDIFYLAQKEHGKQATRDSIKGLLQVFNPAAVTDTNIYRALELEWDDFEDSVQFAVGESLSADFIVTRNVKDFASLAIAVLTPAQFIQHIVEIGEH